MATVTSVGRASGLEPVERAYAALAAEALYERHASRVFGYCLARLRRRDEAEDAAQTTFLHALRSLRRGVVPAIESAWLLGIARNVCLSRWEASGRRSRVETACDPHDLDVGNAAPQRREELAGLEKALALLPEQQRRAVLLRDWRGLSYDEIAGQLDVSHAAVETLIFRGRQRLAELLGEEPATSRRRFSLANLGSLLAAVKSALSGGAAAVKVAVAVIAISGAGLAVGSSGGDSHGDVAHAPAGQAAHAPAVGVVASESRGAAAPAARSVRAAGRAAVTSTARPEPRAAVAPADPHGLDAVPPAPAPTGSAGPRREADTQAAAPASVAPTRELLPAATTVVKDVLPELPVSTPPLPDLPVSTPLPELPVSPPPIELSGAVADIVRPVETDLPAALP